MIGRRTIVMRCNAAVLLLGRIPVASAPAATPPASPTPAAPVIVC
jgi:hypothetical protein